MVLETILGGLASSAGSGLFGSLFGSSPPGPKDILNAQSEVLSGISDQAIAQIEGQTRDLSGLSQEFLNQYVSDASRKGFSKDAKSYANSLFESARQGGISFGDAQNRFMNAALTAGIRPGDKLKGGTLSDYARNFDEAARAWAPLEFNRTNNASAMGLLGRSLTKNEMENVYKFGSMSSEQARELMGKTYEGFSRNFQNTADAMGGWYYGGRAVYPDNKSRFDADSNKKWGEKLGRIA